MRMTTSIRIDGGDFPTVELHDGDVSDQAVLLFTRDKREPGDVLMEPADVLIVFACGDTDDAVDAGFRFALWLETVAEMVRDRAFNARTRGSLMERDEQAQAQADARAEADIDDGPF